MKKIILTTIILLVVILIKAQNLNINDKFPIEKLDFYKPTTNPKIVVCMPSLYEDCEYASMLTNALSFYFQEGLTFNNELKNPVFDIILLINDTDKWIGKNALNQNKTNDMFVQYDSTGKYFKNIGINEFTDINDTLNKTLRKEEKNKISKYFVEIPLVRNQSSILFLLDSNNTILLKDENFRSQGEHLKPLDNFIKEKFCDYKINWKFNYKKLKIGDKAPNFNVDSQNDLNRDTSNLKVITFYPAAFSGTLNPRYFNAFEIYSCAPQIRTFDLFKIDKIPENSKIKGVKKYAVSNATKLLLTYWRKLLGSSQIIFLNDIDNSIAGKYNALNPLGYNNRLTYIIDEKNIIKYIDEAFTKESEAIISSKINEILKEK